jgi:5S rRNA maturation endonuclease (ribonuclease M5)
MKPAERLEAAESALEALSDANAEAPILVEGDRDETALRKLGIHGPIVRLNQGKTVVGVCERLVGRERVIVLTDWDRKGGQLARLVSQALVSNGVKADLHFRKELSRIAHVRTVEGLAGWYATLRESVPPSQRRGP